MANAQGQPAWRDRLQVPNYRVGEAAHYAGVAAQTIAAWQSAGARKGAPLHTRESGAQLSYLDLIELAVVGKFRKAGISLQHIRRVREYVSEKFGSEYPFATFRFKSDGRELVMDLGEVSNERNGGVSLWPTRSGQLSWNAVIDPLLMDFDYEHQIASRWHVDGRSSPIVIDPTISFGAPSIGGIPTWALKDRFVEKEPLEVTADDFGLSIENVEAALRFERVLFDRHIRLS